MDVQKKRARFGANEGYEEETERKTRYRGDELPYATRENKLTIQTANRKTDVSEQFILSLAFDRRHQLRFPYQTPRADICT